MSNLKNKRKAVYGNSAVSLDAEWDLVNSGGGYYDGTYILRKCPFNAVLLRPLLERKGRLLVAGILGAVLGFTGIHFLLTRHTKKGLVRLGVFLAVVLLMWIGFRYLEVAGIAFAVVTVCAMVGLTLFLFGFEEGVFLCNLAMYDVRAAAKQVTRCLLSVRVGKLTVEMILEILLVVAFVVAAVWVYVVYH